MFSIVLTLLVFGCVKLNDGTSGNKAPPPDISNSQKVLPSVCGQGLLKDNSGNCVIAPCPTGQARDSTGNCILLACPAGTIRNNANGCDNVVNPVTPNPINPGYTPSPDALCQPTGYIKEAFAFHKKNIGDTSNVNLGAPLSMLFQVTNGCNANFYFEVGLTEKQSPLSFIVTQPSACDGNPHFTGKFISGNKNTQFNTGRNPGEISIAFFPQDYGKPEDLFIVGGVYTGCYKDGGKSIAGLPSQTISIYAQDAFRYSDSDIVNSVTKII